MVVKTEDIKVDINNSGIIEEEENQAKKPMGMHAKQNLAGGVMQGGKKIPDDEDFDPERTDDLN